jgi:CubicO group peptidase (beta-lactamase class C family)
LQVVQGQVSDENSYALGGIAGHAGVFSNVNDMLTFTGMWAYGPFARGQNWPFLINATTRQFFFTDPRPTFSPRALGWVVQNDLDTYAACGNFSNTTVYHTGYTGTLLCIDPVSNYSFVLLTNRVYPNSTGNTAGILATRRAFANAVLEVLGSE